jgi:hypothetical protein
MGRWRCETAENDLKQLMADVTRAMEKAQEAVGRPDLGFQHAQE